LNLTCVKNQIYCTYNYECYAIYFKVRQALDDVLDKVPEPFNLIDMMSKVEDQTPYAIVSFQECERMNVLMNIIRRSLKELHLGLKV